MSSNQENENETSETNSRSRKVSGYRKLNAKSNVDKSLFGFTKSNNVIPGRNVNYRPTMVSGDDFKALKERSTVLTKAEKEMRKEAEIARTILQRKKIEEQKQALAEIEPIEEKSDETEDSGDRRNEMLKRAIDMEEENFDQVKLIRRKKLYAECAQIREKQIEEKKKRDEVEKLLQDKMEKRMELDRLEAIRQTEEKERILKEHQKKDFHIIQQQIKNRQRQKVLAEEALEQEKKLMLQSIALQEKLDHEARTRKQIEGKELLKQVLVANEEAITRKQVIKDIEKQDEQKILAWQLSKQKREEEIEQQKLEIKAQKDKEFFEVASKMKKSEDNRAEKDFIRAKRHQQHERRKQREAEKKEKARREGLLKELITAKEEHVTRKFQQLQAATLADKKEWERIQVEKMQEQLAIEKEQLKLRESRKAHQVELKKQVHEVEQRKKLQFKEHQEAGRKIRESTNKFLKRVESRKAAILDEMKQSGIPAKYCADVARTKITL